MAEKWTKLRPTPSFEVPYMVRHPPKTRKFAPLPEKACTFTFVDLCMPVPEIKGIN